MPLLKCTAFGIHVRASPLCTLSHVTDFGKTLINFSLFVQVDVTYARVSVPSSNAEEVCAFLDSLEEVSLRKLDEKNALALNGVYPPQRKKLLLTRPS